jgi:hypothetical protein
MRSYNDIEISWKAVFNFVILNAKLYRKPIRDIKEDCCTTSICFHIVVYSFNNFMYLLYDCVFISETNLMNSIIIENLGNRSLSNRFDRTGSKLINLYDFASSADFPGIYIYIYIYIYMPGKYI